MKNEIINKKIIDRGYDWLRIGDILFTIKLYNGEEENIVGNEEYYYKNIIYLKKYDDMISYDDLEIAIKLDVLDAEFKKILDINFNELFILFKECNLEDIVFFTDERVVENTNGTIKMVFSPNFEIIDNKISYLIACDVINWNLQCTMREFMKKLMKHFNRSNKFSPFLAFEDGVEVEEIQNIHIELNLSDIKDYSVLEIENYIKDTIIEVYLEVKNDGKGIKLIITNPEIQFILKQYLIGFPEFIRKITGKIIQFEIETDSDGLRFKIGKNEKLEDIKEELLKYMRLLNNGDSINFELLNNLGLTQIQLIGVKSFVDTQVMTFKHQIIQSNILLSSEREKSEYLLKTSERIEKLFNKHIECNKIENFNLYALNNNHLENKNTIKIDINFNENIEKLQESIFEMKNLLNPLINDLLKEELQEIDDRLMEINDSQELNKNKGIIGKLKRFVNGIKNISGTVILAGQAINISGETFQRLLELKSTILNIISELGK